MWRERFPKYMKPTSDNTAIVIPAYNEEACIGDLLKEIREYMPGYRCMVVNDGSSDRTASVARDGGATVLELPCNLGVGGAVQVGYRFAFESGCRFAIRCDGDGQHPPAEMPKLVARMAESGVDMVIGSRYLEQKSYRSTWFRYCGIRGLSALLSLICRKRVTDPTSGFQLLDRPLLYFFGLQYPSDYPEPEALALMRRQGYDFAEVSVAFRARTAGQSSILAWGTFYYIVKVFLALLVDRCRSIERDFSRERLDYLA
jgi:glycosyltransferase involved in cell wall biosynthesis